MIMWSKEATRCIYFVFSRYYALSVTGLIKKLELSLVVVLILLKVKFGHAQINVPKISKQLSKQIV